MDGSERKTGGGVAVREGVVVNAPSDGRFVGRSELTELQANFVAAYTENGGMAIMAALAAGYAPATAKDASGHLLQNPKVRAAIAERVAVLIETEGAVIGYKVLSEIARDENAPPNVRRLAARDLLVMAGYGRAQPKAQDAPGSKPLAEMTRQELEETVRHSAAILAAARELERPTVEGAAQPLEAQDEAQQHPAQPGETQRT